ncbi:MAG: J domain-containing protein [Deltaproteobacteria bacterium]|nr:J domain-containing protein [Deltaproteobacteria bacterium]
MTTPPNHPCPQERRLTRFIRRVGECNDTPSLIVIIAADAAYLRLCRSIVDPAAEPNSEFAETLVRVCRDNGVNPDRLKETLTPAARALGIVQPSRAAADYYQLLGVRSRANAQEIKKAFRRKAVEVHPDANAELAGSGRRFVELNDAYRTLRDPALRHHYDINRQHRLRWHEHPKGSLPADRSPPVFWWYVCGLIFIFMLLLLTD